MLRTVRYSVRSVHRMTVIVVACVEVELTQILLRPPEEAAQGEGEESSAISFGKADSAGKELLKRLARSDPYYKRNRPHLCTQFAKGSCPRGDACQFRHELPSENGLGKQNILDRYHGRNDPVAHKMLAANAAESGMSREHFLVLRLKLTSFIPSIKVLHHHWIRI